ncbi:MAG: hypothetical protein NNA19_07630 [Nitrospira sp.]|nr:hypothetical protein [Nitrospira sp.]MCP9475107.1 hypothetical protein [Nitrospira sp.]
MTCKRTVSIGSDHPAIAGHFPGRPIVPGVLVLREVLETARDAIGRVKSVAGLPTVKFTSPLKPGELLTVEVTVETAAETAAESARESDKLAPERAAFVCRVDDRIVASGAVEFSAESPAAERA